MTETSPSTLPRPALPRWQPLRLGLVELFHYDSEEFWFRDGRLLLRGNNGTGKSKVLSLTLPLLFDAQLKPSRVEPDGDPGKKMAWNLLIGRHERRMGYTWIEFGRLDEGGQAHYLTLGCGLSAAMARAQVDSWFFLLEQARVGQDLWLMNPSRVVLTRERLRDTLQAHAGQVFDTAATYRRAVDERLFHLGPARYAALMDTLIQLRQPQLSKRPDESNLSNALTEALPPMSTDLLADVADALNQLEEYRRELAEYEALEHAVGQFNLRYRRYAATQARRQAASLRSAQTGFDNASRELAEGRTALQKAQAAEEAARIRHAESETALAASRIRLEELQNDPAMTSAKQLEQAEREADRRGKDAEQAQRTRREAQARQDREQQASRTRAQRVEQAGRAWTEARAEAVHDAERAGIPPGVLNLITADSANSIAIGKALCASATVRHISFTGSTEVGRILMAQSAPTVKKLSLELGGNAPFIVFDDADIDSAVEGAMASKYRNAGQTCVCANRIYVQEGVYDAFVQKFAAKVRALKVGNGFEEGVVQGPLIEPAAVEKVARHLQDALAKGGRVVAGGKQLEGQFFEPTVLADATPEMLCAREETFGPFAPVFRFQTEQEAIAAANATEFGLASYFYSRDVGRIFRVSEGLEYGMVGINVGIIASEHVPFGGVKQSGLGREGSHHGMDEYVEIKYLCVGDILK